METFWLSKEGREVAVTLRKPVPQHQLDGIRFLYRQYIMKFPGIVLNDPTGYGKRLQVVLFLNALMPLLKESRKGALILCEIHDIANWLNHFEQWTDCRNDVTVNSSTPFTRDTIFINPHKDRQVFARKQWAILVVCSDVPSKELLQTNISADFKIWISNINIKENLPVFSSIYKWINPSETFRMEDLTPASDNLSEVVNKKIFLDAFLEDIVLRRTNFIETFDVSNKSIATETSQPGKPVKNKDPTGTKVKRSKKQKMDEGNPSTSTVKPVDDEMRPSGSAANVRSEIKDLNMNTEVVNPSNNGNKDTLDGLFNFETKNNELEKVSANDKNEIAMDLNEIENDNEFFLDDESMQLVTAINDIINNENNSQAHVKNEVKSVGNMALSSANKADESQNSVNMEKGAQGSNESKSEQNEPSEKPKTVLSSLKEVDDKLLECEKLANERFKDSFFNKLF